MYVNRAAGLIITFYVLVITFCILFAFFMPIKPRSLGWGTAGFGNRRNLELLDSGGIVPEKRSKFFTFLYCFGIFAFLLDNLSHSRQRQFFAHPKKC